jgi:KDO2-lipid IV(A) lauroyltransferase
MLSLFSRFIAFLPLWAALALGRFIGFIWYYIIPVRKKLCRENIRRAFGNEMSEKEQKKIARRFFSNFCMSLIEILRIPHMSLAQNEKLVKIEGWEHMEKALERGKGVILFATHIDNVDLGGCSMAMRGAPISVVVRKMGKSAEQFISSVRENTGVTIIPGKNSKNHIRELLAENKIVTIVADQHLSKRRSIACKFFGEWASTTPAPSRFAFETDAAIIPATINRQGKTGYHHVRVSPEFEQETPYDDMDMNIRHNTERLNRIIEQWIREAPDQWWWVHKRWKLLDKPHEWDIPTENNAPDLDKKKN